jgi:sulfate adenylyltransferase
MSPCDCSRDKQGFTVFLTGLPAAGKSTIANFLRVRLMEIDGRSVHLLDSENVRKTFSSGLGFSAEDRNENIRRMGCAAAEVTESGGIVICSAIAPYDAARKTVRQVISAAGGFFLVYVCTPLRVCEARDPKGEYASARAGILLHFTGVSDPYEPPDDAEIIIDTTDTSVEVATEIIVRRLRSEGHVSTGYSRE